MKRILYEIDGQLFIVTPVINNHEDITEEAALMRAVARLPEDAANVAVIDQSVIPTDRTFRDAWTRKKERVEVDMPRARDILRNRLREERKEKLAALDVEYQRADEVGDKKMKTEIAAKKQVLRDLPAHPKIEQAQTAEDLIQFMKEAAWKV